MEITLKCLKQLKNLSDETMAFSCKVAIDGRVAFHASNRGNGGCNEYYPIGKGTWDDIKAATEHAKQTLNEDFEPLDALIERLMDHHENAKLLKRYLKKGVAVVLLPGGSIMLGTEPYTSENKEFLTNLAKHKFPGSRILNDMDFDFAVALMSHGEEILA